MSQIVVHESSDLNDTSEDDELENLHKNDPKVFAKQMVRSKNSADQRFINMYRVRNAYSRGVPIGFKGFDDKPEEDLT